MEYITKSCPHCHKTYSALQPKQGIQFGNPVRICNECGKSFIDRDYVEISVMGIPKKLTRHYNTDFFWFSVLFISLGIIAILSGGMVGWSLLLIFIGLIPHIISFFTYKKRMIALSEEVKKSYDRLLNVEYAKMLKSVGFNVPEQYLKNK